MVHELDCKEITNSTGVMNKCKQFVKVFTNSSGFSLRQMIWVF